MQLQRPTRAVLRVGVSDCCLSRRILWTVRVVHEAFKAISRVPNPCASKVLTRIRCVASSCGAMAVAGTKALTLVGMEEEEDGQGTAKWAKAPFRRVSSRITARSSFVRHYSLGTSEYKYLSPSHIRHRLTPQSLKKLTKKLATPDSPFTVSSSSY